MPVPASILPWLRSVFSPFPKPAILVRRRGGLSCFASSRRVQNGIRPSLCPAFAPVRVGASSVSRNTCCTAWFQMPTFFIEQFGCRATQADGAALERQLLDRGCACAATPAAADIVVVNTCTVTASADAQARNAIRKLHAANPAIRVIGRRSEEHTSELQSRENLVCRLLLEKKKKKKNTNNQKKKKKQKGSNEILH